MRQRVEDFGRLAVLLHNLLDHKLFDGSVAPDRPKYYSEWFAELSKEKKDDVLRAWAYGIENIRDELYALLEIAEGRDRLNDDQNVEG